MSVYRIKYPEDSFEVIDLDMFAFADIIGDEDLTLVRSQPRTNESLKSRWKSVKCNIAEEWKNKPLPAISYWGSYLIFTQKAYDVFANTLEPFGEFLPLLAEGNQLYIYNCLTFVSEDETQCIRSYEDGYPIGFKSLAFENSDLKDKQVFKSKLFGTHTLFATDSFRSLFSQENMTGIRFDTYLVDPF
ncbi:hypothetical protein [Marinomonas spartinae]|uniref:hypothetical protein n=1 Tax=Marinomonas spartinae TaxID=1792290 RepID=UPI0018F1F59D|nr:hypothetical protein [Marinomonas spartinae]MBJ7553848.1 hypothetical protein [Marinomonas spartinae]